MPNANEPKKPEIIQGDKALRQNLFILIALYVLMGVLLDWLIGWIMAGESGVDVESVQQLATRKQHVSNIAFGIWRTLPVLYFLYLSFRIVASARCPAWTSRSSRINAPSCCSRIRRPTPDFATS